jgi:hypothetical protein
MTGPLASGARTEGSPSEVYRRLPIRPYSVKVAGTSSELFDLNPFLRPNGLIPATISILTFRARWSSPIVPVLDIGERVSLSAFLPFFAILGTCWACGFPVAALGQATPAKGPTFVPSCRAERLEQRSATTVQKTAGT